MCYFVLFSVSRSRKMATILTVSRKKFSSVGPPQFQPLNSQIKFAILISVDYTVLFTLVQRI